MRTEADSIENVYIHTAIELENWVCVRGQTTSDGKAKVRWDRVKSYLSENEDGPTSGLSLSTNELKEIMIQEPEFYLLTMSDADYAFRLMFVSA